MQALVKLGLLFDGLVGVILAVPILRYLMSPVTRGGSQAMSIGSLWAGWNSFQ